MTVYLGSVSSVTSCLWYDLQSWLASSRENAGSMLAGWTRSAISVGEQGVMPTQTEPPRCSDTSFVPVRSLLGLSSFSFTQSWILVHAIRTFMLGRMLFWIPNKSLRNVGFEKPFFIFRIQDGVWMPSLTCGSKEDADISVWMTYMMETARTHWMADCLWPLRTGGVTQSGCRFKISLNSLSFQTKNSDIQGPNLHNASLLLLMWIWRQRWYDVLNHCIAHIPAQAQWREQASWVMPECTGQPNEYSEWQSVISAIRGGGWVWG